MLRNFVQETSNAPGTAATINLAGAASGRVAFLASGVFVSGNQCFYFMDDGTQQEAGTGTLTAGSPNTLSRDTVLWNSTVGTASPGRLNFTASTKVYNEVPAERVAYFDATGGLAVAGTLTAGVLYVAKAAGDVTAVISGAAGTNRVVLFDTAGVMRWAAGASTSAESGSNAGSDFVVSRYNDAGAYINSPLIINRGTGVAAFSAPVIAPAGTSGWEVVNIGQFVYGSNGNGAYRVMPGGEQLCRFNLNVPALSSATWTFPLAFASAPQMSYMTMLPVNPIPQALWVAAISPTAATIINQNGYDAPISLIAVR